MNLLSNFALHGKSFYGCSTSGLKNIRKVICGDPSQTLKTPRDLQLHSENMPNARLQLEKSPGQSQLCSHGEYAISALWVLWRSFTVLNTRVWFSIPAGPCCLFFCFYFTPEPQVQVSCQGGSWGTGRERRTARAISLWNIYGALVLWLHEVWTVMAR